MKELLCLVRPREINDVCSRTLMSVEAKMFVVKYWILKFPVQNKLIEAEGSVQFFELW